MLVAGMRHLWIISLFLGFVAAATVCLPQAPDASSGTPWWKGAVLYEIYPRSFQDSSGDGVGDLNGITKRLFYLEKLGADAIWLTPMYASPQVDFGYDVSNFEMIDPQYGTMEDFDNLLTEAKEHHIRILLDMVVNHTSDQHPWFLASRSSRTDPKRDWYVWRDPKGYAADGKPIPPNNWQSVFGHSAWTWDAKTKQFYYHRFYVQQPDLNWRNPQVQQAMFDVLRFWLDKGVAGFRLDAVPALFEDAQFRDDPETGGTNAEGEPNLSYVHTSGQPEQYEEMKRMRALVDSYPGHPVLLGETYVPDVAALSKWYGGEAKDELQLPMDLLLGFPEGERQGRKLDAGYFRQQINAAETQLHGSEPLFVFANHDNPRDWDRFADGAHDLLIAKMIAAMLLTTRDTALLYYGEELGMRTHTPTRIEDVQDPVGKLGWPRDKGRDGERTPMQWLGGAQAGFTTNPRSWLPIGDDAREINVRVEEEDPDSLLNWYLQLSSLRKSNPAFAPDAAITVLMDTAPDVLAYVRTGADGKRVIVAMNMSAQEQAIQFPGDAATPAVPLAMSGKATDRGDKAAVLAPFATLVAELGTAASKAPKATHHATGLR